MLNSSALNTTVLNGESSFSAIGSGAVVSLEQSVGQLGAGSLIDLQQKVGKGAGGILITIAQEQFYRYAGSGELVSVKQEIADTFSGPLVKLSQYVRPNAIQIGSHLERTGWDAFLYIDGVEYSSSRITDQIKITRSENSAAQMQVTIIPPSGTFDPYDFLGKEIYLNVQDASGIHRMYTGIIDVPDIDLINKKVLLKCSDRRSEQINSQLSAVVNNIGYYSDLVFRDVKDTADELEKRLSTTPYTVDFDVYGNYTLTPWLPKATADYSIGADSIYYREPRVEILSRADIVNKITISLEYRYERLHHTERHFCWESPINSNYYYLLKYAYSMTKKDLVLNAIDAAGWPLKGEVDFTDIWESGNYNVDGYNIIWSTIDYEYSMIPIKDEKNKQVYDSDGKPVYQAWYTGATSYTGVYCMKAEWDATIRWAQTITENYTLVVQAPQSQNQFGDVEQSESFSVSDPTNSSDWEDYTAYYDLGLGDSFNIDQDTTRSEFNLAAITLLNKAKTTILDSHRDTKVSLQVPLFPDVDLKHTLNVSSTTISAKGKVYSIDHVLDATTGDCYTDITMSLYRAQGSQSDSALNYPSKPSDTVTYPSGIIYLGNHYGQDPTQAGAEYWNGYVGNKSVVTQFDSVITNYLTVSSYKYETTEYQEMFIVDTPQIPDALRDEKVLYSSVSYNIEIPNDDLVIVL